MTPETSFSRRRVLQLGALTASLPALSSAGVVTVPAR